MLHYGLRILKYTIKGNIFAQISCIRRESLNLHTKTQVLHKHVHEFKYLHVKYLDNKEPNNFYSRDFFLLFRNMITEYQF